MGYDLNIKLKGELDSDFKPICKEPYDTKQSYYSLLAYCLTTKDSPDIIYRNLKFKFSILKSSYEENWKLDLKPNENGEYYFRGWQYAKNDWYEDEDYLSTVFETVYLISINPTPNILEDEDAYWKKVEMLKENLGYIEESVYDYWNGKFVDRYKNEEDSETEESY